MPSSPPVRAFHLKSTVKTIWAKASESVAKYVCVRRTMKKPKNRAPAAATNGAVARASGMGHAAEAHQQVEGGREEGDDRDLGHHDHQEARQHERQHQEQSERDEPAHGGHAAILPAAPGGPRGERSGRPP